MPATLTPDAPTQAPSKGRPRKPRAAEVVVQSPDPAVRAVQPQEEYVAKSDGSWWASSGLAGYRSWLNRLPKPQDDLDVELTIEVRRRMMQDPHINSSVHLLVQAALSRGLALKSAIEDPDDPDYELAQEYTTFCRRNLFTYLHDPIYELLADMATTALVMGNSVAEQTWEISYSGQDSGRLILKTIKAKQPEVYAFVSDPYGNIPGIACYTGAQNSLITPGAAQSYDNLITPQPIEIMPSGWEVLPREKFCVMTFRKRYNDPRGASVLRTAYNAWYLLCQLWPEYLKYLVQFASPSMVGVVAEKSIARKDPNDPTKTIDPVTSLYNSLLGFFNGTVLALPFGTEVDLLWSQGDGSAFLHAIEVLNSQMIKGILHQLLATDEGRHMARAASQTHQDVLNSAIRVIKTLIALMVRNDIFKPLIGYNFGANALRLTPIATLGEVAPEDRAVMMQAYAIAAKSGFLHESQLRAVDADIDLPYRSEPDFGPPIRMMEAKLEAEMEMQETQIAADQQSEEAQLEAQRQNAQLAAQTAAANAKAQAANNSGARKQTVGKTAKKATGTAGNSKKPAPKKSAG